MTFNTGCICRWLGASSATALTSSENSQNSNDQMASRPNFSCLKHVKFIIKNSIQFNIPNGPCAEQWEHRKWRNRQPNNGVLFLLSLFAEWVRKSLIEAHLFCAPESHRRLFERIECVYYLLLFHHRHLYAVNGDLFIIWFEFMICNGIFCRLRVWALFVWFTVSWCDGWWESHKIETAFAEIVSYDCDT